MHIFPGVLRPLRPGERAQEDRVSCEAVRLPADGADPRGDIPSPDTPVVLFRTFGNGNGKGRQLTWVTRAPE